MITRIPSEAPPGDAGSHFIKEVTYAINDSFFSEFDQRTVNQLIQKQIENGGFPHTAVSCEVMSEYSQRQGQTHLMRATERWEKSVISWMITFQHLLSRVKEQRNPATPQVSEWDKMLEEILYSIRINTSPTATEEPKTLPPRPYQHCKDIVRPGLEAITESENEDSSMDENVEHWSRIYKVMNLIVS